MSEQNTMILQQVFADQEEQERVLTFRNQWVPLFYNWVIAGLMIALAVGFVIWSLDIRADKMAASRTAEAIASYQAEQEAEEAARTRELEDLHASEQYIISQEATAAAKALYGVRNFVDKYGYSERDLRTYIRCMINRAEASGRDLAAVIAQEGQFLGYSDQNPVIDEYYRIAIEAVEEWHEETTKPVDVCFQFAELTESGIYLKADINADGYARRWRA